MMPNHAGVRFFKEAAAVFIVAFLGSTITQAQSVPTWITSIGYQQTAGATPTMDIHLGVLQSGDPAFPCGNGNSLTLAPLALSNVIFSGTEGPNSNPGPLNAASEPGGFVYHVPIGVNLNLPDGWQSFAFSVTAQCTGAQPPAPQRTPLITIHRVADSVPLQVTIEGGQPQWNRSGSGASETDSLSFTIQSNRAVSVKNLLVRDSSPPNNAFNLAYSEGFDATQHSITLKLLQPLQGNHVYTYDVGFAENGQPVTPSASLEAISTPAFPTRDYALVQLPTPQQLTIRDFTQPFVFTAQTSDPGNLSVAFDTLQINGSSTIVGTSSADGLTHTFSLPPNTISADGEYSFHYSGSRTGDGATLSNSHESLLDVATKAAILSPIGLGLSSDNQSIVVTFCLSKSTPNQVVITNNPATFSVEAPGSVVTDGKEGCADGTTAYSASLPLAEFSSKVAAPSAGATPAAAAAAPAPQQKPVLVSVVDKSAADRNLTTLNLAAVLLNNQATTDVTNAITTVTNKSSSAAQVTAATQTLQKNGIDQTTINNLIALGKKSGSAGSTIGSVLGAIGKSLLTTYLGIPAASAAAAPAPAAPAAQ